MELKGNQGVEGCRVAASWRANTEPWIQHGLETAGGRNRHLIASTNQPLRVRFARSIEAV